MQPHSLTSAAMDSEKVESLSGQALPGATIPLDSNGAHSGDSEVKKRARSNSPNGEAAEAVAKRQKGVAPIKAESVPLSDQPDLAANVCQIPDSPH